MQLFETGADFKVQLNKEWLLLIPQFKRLVWRDRGSKNDVDGRKKYQTIRELTFIYHFTDPRSPIENIEDLFERREKALQYAELTEKDIDAAVVEAMEEYEYLLDLSVPTLALLRSVKGTLTKLKSFFDNINFNSTDKQGKLLYAPESHIKNVVALGKLHKEVMAFEEIVLAELKAQKQARGKMELGDREQSGTKKKWAEGKYNPHSIQEPLSTSNDSESNSGNSTAADISSPDGTFYMKTPVVKITRDSDPQFARLADEAKLADVDDYIDMDDEEDN